MLHARFVLAGLFATVVGIGLLSRLSREPRSGPGLVGMGFFVGVLACALWTHLLLIVRVPVNGLTVCAGPAIAAALGRWRCLGEAVWKRPPAWSWLTLAAAVFLIWGAFAFSLVGADGAVFYALKAKSIVVHGTFWNEDFLDPARLHMAHRRPLLLPGIYADLFLATGSFDYRMLRVWFTLLLLGALGGMYDVLRGRVGRNEAAMGTALFAWCPVLWGDAGGAASGYGDAALSMIILFALTCERPLAVFLVAAGALLKDDGMAFILPFALVRGVRLAAAPAALAATWVAVASRLPRDGDFLPANFLHPHLSSIPFILRHVAAEFVAVKHWGFLWLTILAVLAWRSRSLGKQDARILVPLGVQLLIYIGVWTTFPFELLRGLIGVEDSRLMYHLMPAAWVWAVWRANVPAPTSVPPVVPA